MEFFCWQCQLTTSYLMQTVIALVALAVLSTIHRGRLNRSERNRTQGTSPRLGFPTQSPATKADIGIFEHDQDHFKLRVHVLSEFHKAQCLYSIALQMASFAAIYGGNKNQEDDMFLLLVSADGLVPVALVLYTLLLFEHANGYHVILSTISALLASITGFSVILGFDYVGTYGGSWPATCGGLAPSEICSYQFHFGVEGDPNLYFIGGAIAIDIVIIALVMWYVLARAKIHEYPNTLLSTNRSGVRLAVIILHASAVLILLTISALELYWLITLLIGPSIMDYDWGFGQIVGITIWAAVVIDLVRHEVGMCQRPKSLSPPFLTAWRARSCDSIHWLETQHYDDARDARNAGLTARSAIKLILYLGLRCVCGRRTIQLLRREPTPIATNGRM